MTSKATVLLEAALLLVIMAAAACSSEETAMETPPVPTETGNRSPQVVDPERAAASRDQIESAYPEFRDFEMQDSFAGKSVKSEAHDGDYYFAYIVHGSGLPMVEATCFRVDRAGRVFQVGVFPDPVDSYAGYRDVDLRNCRGIK